MTDPTDKSSEAPRICRMAVVSFVLGVLSLPLIVIAPAAGLPAIFLGHRAVARVRRAEGALRGHGLAVAGYLLGYFTVTFWLYGAWQLRVRETRYVQTAYQRDYRWGTVEVGTALNHPKGRPVQGGRYASVIAFEANDTNRQVLLYAGPRGEDPRRPEFVSGSSNVVTYRLAEGGTTNLVIRVERGRQAQ